MRKFGKSIVFVFCLLSSTSWCSEGLGPGGDRFYRESFNELSGDLSEKSRLKLLKAIDEGSVIARFLYGAVLMEMENSSYSDSLDYFHMNNSQDPDYLFITALANSEKLLYPKNKTEKIPKLSDWLQSEPYNYIEAAKWKRLHFYSDHRGESLAVAYEALLEIFRCFQHSRAKEYADLAEQLLTPDDKLLLKMRKMNSINISYCD